MMALWQPTQQARSALEATTLNMRSVAVRLEVPAHKTGKRQVSKCFSLYSRAATSVEPQASTAARTLQLPVAHCRPPEQGWASLFPKVNRQAGASVQDCLVGLLC